MANLSAAEKTLALDPLPAIDANFLAREDEEPSPIRRIFDAGWII
jgi:hypothetical protein